MVHAEKPGISSKRALQRAESVFLFYCPERREGDARGGPRDRAGRFTVISTRRRGFLVLNELACRGLS